LLKRYHKTGLLTDEADFQQVEPPKHEKPSLRGLFKEILNLWR
jgi:hypothetical protein